MFFKNLHHSLTPLLTANNIRRYRSRLFSENPWTSNVIHWTQYCSWRITTRQLNPCHLQIHPYMPQRTLEKEHNPTKRKGHNAIRSTSIGKIASTSHTSEQECICPLCHKRYSDKCKFIWIECCDCFVWLHKKCDPYIHKNKQNW